MAEIHFCLFWLCGAELHFTIDQFRARLWLRGLTLSGQQPICRAGDGDRSCACRLAF